MTSPIEPVQSVGSKLLDEIVRVSAKRERWIGYKADLPPNAQFGMDLTINLMANAVENAKTAIASGDALACIQALADLEGYDSDD